MFDINFRSADEADAVQSADFLGKKRVIKRSWGSLFGSNSVGELPFYGDFSVPAHS